MRTLNLAKLVFLPLSVAMMPATAAEPAGRLIYAHGDVAIRGGDGQPRAVTRGAPVAPGDTVVTGSGRTHVSFADGGFIAVQPNTQFRVDEYNYAGKEDGSERSFFALVKGGVRFISGAIGHTNKANYKIRTPVATIGIRGSAGRLEVCSAGSCGNLPDGVYLTGNQDTLTLNNSTGTTEVGVGQTFHTSCPTCPPQQVRQAPGAYVSLNEGDGEGNTAEEPGFMAGSQVDANGNPLAVADFDPDLAPPPTPPPSGTASYFVEGVPATLTQAGEFTYDMTADVVLTLNLGTGAMRGFISGFHDDGETSFQFLADAAGGAFTSSGRTAGAFDLVGNPAQDAGCFDGPCGFTNPTALNGSSSYTVGSQRALLDGSYQMTGTNESGESIVIQGNYVAPRDTSTPR
jgi:hypothetical protein